MKTFLAMSSVSDLDEQVHAVEPLSLRLCLNLDIPGPHLIPCRVPIGFVSRPNKR